MPLKKMVLVELWNEATGAFVTLEEEEALALVATSAVEAASGPPGWVLWGIQGVVTAYQHRALISKFARATGEVFKKFKATKTGRRAIDNKPHNDDQKYPDEAEPTEHKSPPKRKLPKKKSVPPKKSTAAIKKMSTAFSSTQQAIALPSCLFTPPIAKTKAFDFTPEQIGEYVTTIQESKGSLATIAGKKKWDFIGGSTFSLVTTTTVPSIATEGVASLNSIPMLEKIAGTITVTPPTYNSTTYLINDTGGSNTLVDLRNQQIVIHLRNPGENHVMCNLMCVQSTDDEMAQPQASYSFAQYWRDGFAETYSGAPDDVATGFSPLLKWSDNAWLKSHFKKVKENKFCMAPNQEVIMTVGIPGHQVHSYGHRLKVSPFTGRSAGGSAETQYKPCVLKSGEIHLMLEIQGDLDTTTNDFRAATVHFNIQRRYEWAKIQRDSSKLLQDTS